MSYDDVTPEDMEKFLVEAAAAGVVAFHPRRERPRSHRFTSRPDQPDTSFIPGAEGSNKDVGSGTTRSTPEPPPFVGEKRTVEAISISPDDVRPVSRRRTGS
jgi:hypothetical protein